MLEHLTDKHSQGDVYPTTCKRVSRLTGNSGRRVTVGKTIDAVKERGDPGLTTRFTLHLYLWRKEKTALWLAERREWRTNHRTDQEWRLRRRKWLRVRIENVATMTDLRWWIRKRIWLRVMPMKLRMEIPWSVLSASDTSRILEDWKFIKEESAKTRWRSVDHQIVKRVANQPRIQTTADWFMLHLNLRVCKFHPQMNLQARKKRFYGHQVWKRRNGKSLKLQSARNWRSPEEVLKKSCQH